VTRVIALLWSESLRNKCAKLHIVEASNNRDHPMRSLYYRLFMPHIYGFYSSCPSHWWWIARSTQCQPRGCNNIPSFSQQTSPIAHSFCEGCIWHDLHMMVTAPVCCNRKAWAASAQSFTLWQQAIIEITRRDHSVIACLCHICQSVWVLFFRLWWIANSTQRQQRACKKYIWISACSWSHDLTLN